MYVNSGVEVYKTLLICVNIGELMSGIRYDRKSHQSDDVKESIYESHIVKNSIVFWGMWYDTVCRSAGVICGMLRPRN